MKTRTISMSNRILRVCLGLIMASTMAMLATAASAQTGEPIKIGTSLPLTGGKSVNGEKHRKGFVTWAEMVNEKGGLLGRPVELIRCRRGARSKSGPKASGTSSISSKTTPSTWDGP